jgi:hypothetical protein
MQTEGSLSLSLKLAGNRVVDAGLASSRPLAASRLLEGRTRAEVLRGVPLLFSLCGRAQTVAAAAALDAAEGASTQESVLRRRELLLAFECGQEYLWRLLLDWPALLGAAADGAGFGAWRRRWMPFVSGVVAQPDWPVQPAGTQEVERWREAAADLGGFLAHRVFGEAPQRWLERGPDPAGWLAGAGTLPARWLAEAWDLPAGDCDVALLPQACAAALTELAGWLDVEEGFAARPHWRGAPAETGALARLATHPLVSPGLARHGRRIGMRLWARLVDLALLERRLTALAAGETVQPWVAAVSAAQGVGTSAVNTARGLLLHEVRLERGRLVRYRIVAPTEWNFHPQGAFRAGLLGRSFAGAAQAERAARLMVHALDPCVAFSLKLEADGA